VILTNQITRTNIGKNETVRRRLRRNPKIVRMIRSNKRKRRKTQQITLRGRRKGTNDIPVMMRVMMINKRRRKRRNTINIIMTVSQRVVMTVALLIVIPLVVALTVRRNRQLQTRKLQEDNGLLGKVIHTCQLLKHQRS